jgi:hypothetical protein
MCCVILITQKRGFEARWRFFSRSVNIGKTLVLALHALYNQSRF